MSIETASGIFVFGAAARAADTARFTLLCTPSDHGAGCSVRARKLSVNGVAAKSCTAALASSAVIPPTSTVWMVTPDSMVAGGVCANAGAAATKAPTEKAAATTPRTVTAILFIEQAGVIRNRTVGSCRKNAPEVVAGLQSPREDGRAPRMAAGHDPRGHERVVEHR